MAWAADTATELALDPSDIADCISVEYEDNREEDDISM